VVLIVGQGLGRDENSTCNGLLFLQIVIFGCTVECNIFALQFVVNANETTQENELVNDDKIIAPLKESVSEVEKLVRAGVYEVLCIVCTYFGGITEN
jgi:hypothetical protein